MSELNRITDYPEATELSDDDYVFIDNGVNSKKFLAKNMGGGGGGTPDWSILTPMDYYYRNTDSGEEGDTPVHNLALEKNTYYLNHSNTSIHSHTTYNQNTKYIVVDDDFDAVLQYTLHGYSDSSNYAQGALYYNDEQIAFLQALFNRYTSVFIPLHLKAGDTLAIRKPQDYGWSYHELFINFVGDPDA